MLWLKTYFLYELEPEPAKKYPEPVKNGPAPQHCQDPNVSSTDRKLPVYLSLSATTQISQSFLQKPHMTGHQVDSEGKIFAGSYNCLHLH